MAWIGRRYGEHPLVTATRWANEKTKQEHRDMMARAYTVHGYQRCGDKWVKATPGTGAPTIIPPPGVGNRGWEACESYEDTVERMKALFAKDAVIAAPPPPNVGSAARSKEREAWEAFKSVPWWGACIWFVLGLLANEILRAIT